MSKDHLERRMYRKSPGRQYGYDYDPLRSRSGTGQASQKSHSGSTASGAGTILAQRPDPRRTRQLLRKSIIASKQHTDESEPRPPARSRRPAASGPASMEGAYASQWHEMSAANPGSLEQYPSARSLGYEDDDEGYIDDYLDGSAYKPADVAAAATTARVSRRLVDPKATRRLNSAVDEEEESPSQRVYPAEDADYDYEYEFGEDRSQVKRSNKKRLTRRGLLFGAGALAAAGAGFALVENAPKLPQAASTVAGDINGQVQDAFNRGIAQGADQARKEIITSLGNLEGFTLDGAVTAARLTRVAYDVFVSPVVKFGSVLTGDFLSGMLAALKKAREWLAGVYQDNATLIAIQKVLESWVNDIQKLPKQLDSITEADLDGAQSYLRALQRKIQDEQAKLNQSSTKQATPTPATKATPTPKSK
jgi:hypothetical protein